MNPRKTKTDTDRAIKYVLEHFPKVIPNGHLVDELSALFRTVRRDEARKVRARLTSSGGSNVVPNDSKGQGST